MMVGFALSVHALIQQKIHCSHEHVETIASKQAVQPAHFSCIQGNEQLERYFFIGNAAC